MERRTFGQMVIAVAAAVLGWRPSWGKPDPSPGIPTLPILEVQGADFKDGPWREVSLFKREPRYLRVAVKPPPDMPHDVHYGAEPLANGWYRIWTDSRNGRYTGSAFIKPGRPYGFVGAQVEFAHGAGGRIVVPIPGLPGPIDAVVRT